MAGRGSAGAEENFEKGDRHYYGQGVRKNLALALRAYRKAAEQGHAAAQNRLGWMYEKGEGTEADHAEAVIWYQRAAEQGHINAMNDLGYMHRQGWGVSQSYSEAIRWFRKAAEKYDSYAEYNMGQMYEKRLGRGKGSGRGHPLVPPLGRAWPRMGRQAPRGDGSPNLRSGGAVPGKRSPSGTVRAPFRKAQARGATGTSATSLVQRSVEISLNSILSRRSRHSSGRIMSWPTQEKLSPMAGATESLHSTHSPTETMQPSHTM